MGIGRRPGSIACDIVAKVPAKRRSALPRRSSDVTVGEILSRPYEIDFKYGEQAGDGVLAYVVEWPDCFAAGRDRTAALTALERAMREPATYRLAPRPGVPDA